jgi:hypothetical protein
MLQSPHPEIREYCWRRKTGCRTGRASRHFAPASTIFAVATTGTSAYLVAVISESLVLLALRKQSFPLCLPASVL